MGRMVAGRFKSAERASGYIAFYPCLQPNSAGETSLLDRSGKGNHAGLSTLTTGEAWGTLANRFSTLAAASKKGVLAKATFAAGWLWNASRRDSLLIHARVRVALPVGNTNILGNSNGVNESGLKWQITPTGQWSFSAHDQVNAANMFSSASLVDGSWGGNHHSLCVYLDGPNNTYTRYVDGALLDGPLSMSAVTIIEPNASTFDFHIGGSQLVATSIDCNWLGIHILAAPQKAGSCRDPALLARRLHQSPLVLVQRGEWPY